MVRTQFDVYTPYVFNTYGGIYMDIRQGGLAGEQQIILTFYEHGWYMMDNGAAVGVLPMDTWASFQIDADYATHTYTDPVRAIGLQLGPSLSEEAEAGMRSVESAIVQ